MIHEVLYFRGKGEVHALPKNVMTGIVAYLFQLKISGIGIISWSYWVLRIACICFWILDQSQYEEM